MDERERGDGGTQEAVDDFRRRLMTAVTGSGESLKALVHDQSEEVLRALAANPDLDEDDLLLLLERNDLPIDLLRQVASDPRRTASYRVRLALLRNPQTPASASLKFVPQVHLLDLVTISLIPHVPREVKTSAEGAVLARLGEVPLGIRVTIARRTGSPRVLTQLFLDDERTVVEAASVNRRATEESVLRALRDERTPDHTVDVVSRDSRWSPRRDVRLALVRCASLPLARALAFLDTLRSEDFAALAEDPAVPERLRSYIRRAKLGAGPAGSLDQTD